MTHDPADRRPKPPPWVRRLRWPIPGVLVLLLAIAMFALLMLRPRLHDSDGIGILLILGVGSLAGGLAAMVLLVACLCTEYSDPLAPDCLRCGYPRPFHDRNDMQPCSECGHCPAQPIKPTTAWRVIGAVTHAAEFAVLICFGLGCLWLAHAVAAME